MFTTHDISHCSHYTTSIPLFIPCYIFLNYISKLCPFKWSSYWVFFYIFFIYLFLSNYYVHCWIWFYWEKVETWLCVLFDLDGCVLFNWTNLSRDLFPYTQNPLLNELKCKLSTVEEGYFINFLFKVLNKLILSAHYSWVVDNERCYKMNFGFIE